MEELDEFDYFVPENIIENNVSTIPKSSMQQYQLSLKSESNAVSHHLLKDMWQKHSELFNGPAVQHIAESVNLLFHNRNKDNIATWKSSLSSLDPEKLFETDTCTCSLPISNNLETFLNTTCKCEGMNVPNQQTYSRNNSDELRSEERVFKPKFSKKSKFGITGQISNSKEQKEFVEKDVEEENRAHNNAVNKATFKTARDQLLASNPALKRTLGTSRKAQSKFVSPMIGAQEKEEVTEPVVSDDRLKHLDPKMVELIENEIIDKGTPVGWDDIAGLQMAKSVIQEAVVWPLLRPDIFTGLRRPPKGILLFGPPGTGKTLIGKCIASQCKATFFSISASSLTSKWIGDGEKMVRALFAVATCHQPAVIFIDEIDSLLTQRSDTEHEATRRIKTEFLVQFDGAATADEDRILIVGATNRPQELDEAARRRLVKRLYIPLPDADARKQIITNLLKSESNDLTESQIDMIAARTDGYSGADMKSLCSEAAMGPIRSVPFSQIVSIQRDKVRPVNTDDFLNALQRVRPSVSQDDLGQYVKWNNTYGQGF